MSGNKIAFLILLCLVYVLAYSQPNDDLVVDGSENGVNLRFKLDKGRYYEGEDIILHYTKSSTATTFSQWDESEIRRCIMLLDEAGDTLNSSGVKFPMQSPPLSNYSGDIFLSSAYSNVAFNGLENTFRHLKAERYEIVFLCSPPMPPLEFSIEALPDSLAEAWNKFSSLIVMLQGRHSLNLSSEEVLARSTEILRYFLDRPIGTVLRKDALHKGLECFDLNRQGWTPQDSITCTELLHAYSIEPTADAESVLIHAKNTIFKNMPYEERIAQIRAYAESLNDPKAIEALESVLGRIRNHNQQD